MTDDADDGLVEQLRGLNQRFYSSAPHAYFHQRLCNLWAVAASDDEWGPQLREGIDACGLTLSAEPTDSVGSELTPEERKQYVIADTEVLHHQIAETLIRLYAAHGPDVECPWLNLSNEYDFGAFKASVEANLVKPRAEQLAGLCREVFLGRWPHPPERLNLTQEQWDAGALNLARFMKHFGKHFLEQAQLYNAAKHGMAVNANRGSFRMSDEEGRSVGHEGPSLSYLERQKVTRKPRVDSYQVVQRWVGVVPTWFICSYGTKMMRNLWFYARSRFLEQVNGFELCLPTDVNPLSIQRELGALMPFEAKLDAVEVESGPRLSSSW